MSDTRFSSNHLKKLDQTLSLTITRYKERKSDLLDQKRTLEKEFLVANTKGVTKDESKILLKKRDALQNAFEALKSQWQTLKPHIKKNKATFSKQYGKKTKVAIKENVKPTPPQKLPIKKPVLSINLPAIPEHQAKNTSQPSIKNSIFSDPKPFLKYDTECPKLKPSASEFKLPFFKRKEVPKLPPLQPKGPELPSSSQLIEPELHCSSRLIEVESELSSTTQFVEIPSFSLKS